MNTDLNLLMKGIAELRTRQILLTKFFTETEDIYENSYVFAVCKSVYPMYHEDRLMEDDEDLLKMRLPFYETYEVPEDVITEFGDFLDQNWLQQKYFTFYELESHYRNNWRGKDLRWDLINCLRYFYLYEAFDKPFWDMILKPSEHPTEAQRIIKAFSKTELY